MSRIRIENLLKIGYYPKHVKRAGKKNKIPHYHLWLPRSNFTTDSAAVRFAHSPSARRTRLFAARGLRAFNETLFIILPKYFATVKLKRGGQFTLI